MCTAVAIPSIAFVDYFCTLARLTANLVLMVLIRMQVSISRSEKLSLNKNP